MSNVLIIDDQFTGRKILAELVQHLEKDLSVAAFADPLEALDWSRDHQPDLVLTDYKMPQMDGVEFIQRFRTLPHCADTPLVVVTVVEDRQVRYSALEAGATDFLNKPIDHYECQARCRNLLTLRRQQRIIRDRARWLEQQVAIATLEIRTREYDTLMRLAKAGEYRDMDTGNHVIRMAKYSRLVAEQLELLPQECDVIEQAAPLHDIGKIGVPDSILLKRGRLTQEERAVMQSHTRMGYEILKGSPSKYLQMGALIALSHHERYDGRGYPEGIAGDAIPLPARIVAVADVFDALTTVRPYKDAWSIDEAVEYLDKERDRHFDARCVDAFLADMERVGEIRSRFPEQGNEAPAAD